MAGSPITTLFTDVGGVLLTNGWDRSMRKRAAETFGLDYEEMDERHHLTFDTYEEGKLSLDQYLNRVIFYEPRSFTREAFKEFMFSQSKPFPEMITLFRDLKARYGLKMVAVSNEGRELTMHRIKEFQLDSFIDTFVSSCFVHFRKPDEDMFRVALDLANVTPEEVVYLEDRQLFVEVATSMGLRGIRHKDYETTRSALADLGLAL